MRSILITGCNRGIGLGLVKHLCQKSELKHIIATCRHPDNAQELQELSRNYKNVHILQAEMKDTTRIEELAKSVSKILGDEGLNILINNAGISSKFSRLQYVKADQLMEHFAVNTVAPIMMAKAFLPLLKKAVKQNEDKPKCISKAAIINISTILASIGQNDQGGLYPYRTSKAALNAATKTMSIDLKSDEIIVLSLHPGWVKTDMGGPKAPIDVDTSATGVIKFLYNMSEKHNGGFYSYDGNELFW